MDIQPQDERKAIEMDFGRRGYFIAAVKYELLTPLSSSRLTSPLASTRKVIQFIHLAVAVAIYCTFHFVCRQTTRSTANKIIRNVIPTQISDFQLFLARGADTDRTQYRERSNRND